MSIKKRKLVKSTIKIDNYIRYWSQSVDNGHDIQIAKTDGSMVELELRWPKGVDHIHKPGRAHKKAYK